MKTNTDYITELLNSVKKAIAERREVTNRIRPIYISAVTGDKDSESVFIDLFPIAEAAWEAEEAELKQKIDELTLKLMVKD